jgi:hypothetical protein
MALPESYIRNRQLQVPPPPTGKANLSLVPPVHSISQLEPAAMIATRPRVVPEDPTAPDTVAGKAPVAAPQMGRGRAFFLAALSALGPAVQNAQQAANARGNGVHLSDVASALVGAGSAGAAGAFSPQTVEYAQAQQQAARQQTIEDERQAREGEQAKIDLQRAQAQALRVPKPVRTTPLQHVTVGDKVMVFDPDTGTLSDSGVRGGLKLKLDHDEAGAFLYDPDNPEAPVKRLTGTEARQFINVPGYGRMTPGQKYTADQGAERFNIEQGNRAEDKATGDQRYGESRYDADANAALPYYTKMENARADAQSHAQAAHDFYTQAETYRTNNAALLSSADPKVKANAQANYDALRAKADAELRAQQTSIKDMQTSAEVLKSRYGHIYDVGGTQGADSQFYPAAVMRPRPPLPPTPKRTARTVTPAPNGGRYAGQVFSRSTMDAAAKRLGVKDAAAAEALITANGGIVR